MDARPEFARSYSWGLSLKLETQTGGGLKAAVDRIHGAMSDMIGSRSTFTKLFALDAPPASDTTEALRALVLVEALGLDPQEWGVANVEMPPAINVVALRERLQSPPQLPGGDKNGPGTATSRYARRGPPLRQRVAA